MLSRRELLRRSALSVAGACVGASAWSRTAGSAQGPIGRADLDFLKGMAEATVQSATVAPGPETGNTCGFPLITPGGHYPAMWVRDLSMACGCGVVGQDAMRDHLRLIARTQNGPVERRLSSGAIVPPFAIPDHINFDGRPVFYPGTYDSGERQGGEPWGVLPPVDDQYEFVNIAYRLFRLGRSGSFLSETVEGRSLWERLVLALDAPKVGTSTGLVATAAPRRAVGFGFCDTVYLTGDLLFPSILRYRALGQMLELADGSDRSSQSARFAESRALLAEHIPKAFASDGWLLAATDVGRQPDVWGTLAALHLGLLRGSAKSRTLAVVAKAVESGTITHLGAVRHVPSDRDFSKSSAWEKTAGVGLNTYQNGAYWHVPTGWLAHAMLEVDAKRAKGIVDEMVSHFRAEDWRARSRQGAPWECVGPNGYRQNPVYMASITMPLQALQELGSRLDPEADPLGRA